MWNNNQEKKEMYAHRIKKEMFGMSYSKEQQQKKRKGKYYLVFGI